MKKNTKMNIFNDKGKTQRITGERNWTFGIPTKHGKPSVPGGWFFSPLCGNTLVEQTKADQPSPRCRISHSGRDRGRPFNDKIGRAHV